MISDRPARPIPPPIQRERWVCFHCRKMLRPYLAHGPEADARRAAHAVPPSCPDCHTPMRRIGRYFKAPRRADVKQWEKVRLLLAHGIDFNGYQGRPPARLSEVADFLERRAPRSEGERLLKAIARKNAARPRRKPR